MTTSSPSSPVLPARHAEAFEWSDNLLTGDARMDHTHEEFAQLLNTLLATPASDQLPLYLAFLEHTVAHFAQEDRWMQTTGFIGGNCHREQHAMVLETMQAVVAPFQKGETDLINRMGEALGEWFAQHAVSMDAGLAQYLQSVGFDSATETLADPQAIRNIVGSGCGSVSSS